MQKSFEEWERIKGMMAYNLSRYKTSKLMTEEEFNTILNNNFNDFHGVEYEVRVKFLKDNGYEVNRENLINPELSVREQQEG